MTLAMAPIRTAIREVLEGSLGSVRTVPAGTVARGAQQGRSVTSRQAQSLVTPRYDVRIESLSPHPSTPVGAIGSHRLDDATVTIEFAYKLSSTILDDQRDELRDQVMDDLDVCWQALARPGNLTQTSAAVATNIISGLLHSPSSIEVLDENWDEKILTAQIVATATLQVSQPTA